MQRRESASLPQGAAGAAGRAEQGPWRRRRDARIQRRQVCVGHRSRPERGSSTRSSHLGLVTAWGSERFVGHKPGRRSAAALCGGFESCCARDHSSCVASPFGPWVTPYLRANTRCVSDLDQWVLGSRGRWRSALGDDGDRRPIVENPANAGFSVWCVCNSGGGSILPVEVMGGHLGGDGWSRWQTARTDCDRRE